MSTQKLRVKSLSGQAKEAILQYIEEMDLKTDNKLPREEALAEMLGVSRITIRQALNDLAAEGIIFRRQGRGTFVNVDSLNIKVTFSPCMELTQMIKKSGYAPSVRLLNIQKAKREEEICSLLQMQPDEQLVVAEKLFLADDKICAFCRDYFGMNLIGGEEAFDMFSKYEDSIYKYIYELSGEKAQWDKVEIDTVNPAEIAGLKKYVSVKELGLSPYLYLKTLNYSEKDKPLVYANEYFNTEIIKFNLIRQKNIQY
ncbi:MAG: GntR family transcriptional regulator [[Ruminococcus] gnavus]|nr:GntR family transcriptional regulator [Mediterraneibacter gnavus]